MSTERYHRQSQLFGDEGQAILRDLTVGVIGAGGTGSLVTEFLARLGVGHFVVVDPDHVELTNLPRLIGTSHEDIGGSSTGLQRGAITKVELARRLIAAANPRAQVETVARQVQDADVARLLIDCDYLFLAADSMQARLLLNAVVHRCPRGSQSAQHRG